MAPRTWDVLDLWNAGEFDKLEEQTTTSRPPLASHHEQLPDGSVTWRLSTVWNEAAQEPQEKSPSRLSMRMSTSGFREINQIRRSLAGRASVGANPRSSATDTTSRYKSSRRSARYSEGAIDPDTEGFASLQAAFPSMRDAKLRRFVKAMNGNVEAAKEFLTKHAAWLDGLPADLKAAAMPELRKGKLHIHGKDKLGRPLFIWQTSLNDPKTRDVATVAYSAIYWSLRLEALVDAESERLAGEGVEAAPPCQAPLPSGNLAEGAFVIDRIRGVSDLPALSAVIPVLQDNFPELLGAIYIVPTGVAIRMAFGALSPVLNAQTRNLLKMVASSEELRKNHVDAGQLPQRLGGTDAWGFDAVRDLL